MPPHSAAGESDLIIKGPAAAHDDPYLVPTESAKVLDTYGVGDNQTGKGSGMLIVLSLDLLSMGGISEIAVLGASLPLFGEGCWIGKDTQVRRLAL